MMKTPQRPAYAGKPQYGKSSAAGLLLNFSPLEFDDAEVDAGVFSYGTDGDHVLKKLRQEHWSSTCRCIAVSRMFLRWTT